MIKGVKKVRSAVYHMVHKRFIGKIRLRDSFSMNILFSQIQFDS